METKNKKTVILLILASVMISMIPLFVLKDAEFCGSDDAGKNMIEKIQGEYIPWFTPVLETILDGGLPEEAESLFFCLQTGIGTGILAFCFGRMYERKKRCKEDEIP